MNILKMKTWVKDPSILKNLSEKIWKKEAKIRVETFKIGSGVSKTTTHLIMKVVGSGSSKEKKAMELGVKIMTVEQLESMLR